VKTIVLVRVTEESEVVSRTAVPISRGGGESVKWRGYLAARAMIWLNEGTDDDEVKAQEYAKKEGYTVFTYDTMEPDPLGRAKRDALVVSDVKADCIAALFHIELLRFWSVTVDGHQRYAIGPNAEIVEAAIRDRYHGDWDIKVVPCTEAPTTDRGKRVRPCEWCKKHAKYSH
jgi:hypothetical protein